MGSTVEEDFSYSGSMGGQGDTYPLTPMISVICLLLFASMQKPEKKCVLRVKQLPP